LAHNINIVYYGFQFVKEIELFSVIIKS